MKLSKLPPTSQSKSSSSTGCTRRHLFFSCHRRFLSRCRLEQHRPGRRRRSSPSTRHESSQNKTHNHLAAGCRRLSPPVASSHGATPIPRRRQGGCARCRWLRNLLDAPARIGPAPLPPPPRLRAPHYRPGYDAAPPRLSLAGAWAHGPRTPTSCCLLALRLISLIPGAAPTRGPSLHRTQPTLHLSPSSGAAAPRTAPAGIASPHSTFLQIDSYIHMA